MIQRLAAVILAFVAFCGCSLLSPAAQADATAIKADFAKIETDLSTAAEGSLPAVQALIADLSTSNWFAAAFHVGPAIEALGMAAPALIADFEALAGHLKDFFADATSKEGTAAREAATQAQATAARMRVRAVSMRVAQPPK